MDQNKRFLVEITKPMSVTFKVGMIVWCKYVSDRGDFRLATPDGRSSDLFGSAYKPHFKIHHETSKTT